MKSLRTITLAALPQHSIAQPGPKATPTTEQPSTAASYTASGTILDNESGNPIPYATVYLTARSPKTAPKTDTTTKTVAPATPEKTTPARRRRHRRQRAVQPPDQSARHPRARGGTDGENYPAIIVPRANGTQCVF